MAEVYDGYEDEYLNCIKSIKKTINALQTSELSLGIFFNYYN